jgi:hypothetical protein
MFPKNLSNELVHVSKRFEQNILRLLENFDSEMAVTLWNIYDAKYVNIVIYFKLFIGFWQVCTALQNYSKAVEFKRSIKRIQHFRGIKCNKFFGNFNFANFRDFDICFFLIVEKFPDLGRIFKPKNWDFRKIMLILYGILWLYRKFWRYENWKLKDVYSFQWKCIGMLLNRLYFFHIRTKIKQVQDVLCGGSFKFMQLMQLRSRYYSVHNKVIMHYKQPCMPACVYLVS